MGKQILVQFVSLFVSLSLEYVAPLTEVGGGGVGGCKKKGGKKKKRPATCDSLGGSRGSSHVYFCGEQTKRKIRDVSVSSISRYRCYKESPCRRGCTAVFQPSLFKGER